MKKIGLLLILILINYAQAWSQASSTGTSIYRINVNGRVDGEGSDCGDSRTGGLQWIALIRQNDNGNAGHTVIQGSDAYPWSGRGIKNRSYNHNYDFTKTNPVEEIKWHTTRRSGGLTCGSTEERWSTRSVGLCQKSSYDFKSHMGLNQPGYTNISVFPVVTLNQPSVANRRISSKEYLTITLTDNIDNSYYNWEFAVGAGSFQPIPSVFNRKPVLNLKGEDFLPESAFGKTIYIRVNMGDCAGESRKSDTQIAFNYNKSAPAIISTEVADPTCNGYDDGFAKVKLDRELEIGENLVAMYDGKSIPVVLDNDLCFTIPNLEGSNSGKTYTIQLSGSYNGYALYTDGVNHKKTIIVRSPSALVFTSMKTDILCHDYHTGKVELNVSGGNNAISAPGNVRYYLHWKKEGEQYPSDSIAFVANQNTMTMENLPHGEYQFFVTDYRGCFYKTPANQTKESTEQSQEITQPDTPITVSLIDSLRPSGYGLSNGFLKMNVVGGIRSAEPQKYTVTWNNKKTGQQLKQELLHDMPNFEILDIPAGTYQLKVASAHCDTLLEYSLGQPDALIIDVSQSAPILCNGDNNATLTAQAKGGVLADGENYDYEWYAVGSDDKITGGVLSYTNRLENMGKGKYQVKATDKSRIPNDTIQTILITQPDPVAFSIANFTYVSCHNGNDASITIQAGGGVGRYRVNYWLKEDPSVSNILPFGTGNNSLKIENLIAGTYIISVTDGNDCTGYFNETDDLYEVIITQPEPIAINLEQFKNPSGFGLSNGFITYRISGGTFTNPSTPSYTVEITDSLSNIIPNTASVDGQALLVKAENLPKGCYTISVKDGNYVPNGLARCINTYTLRLTEPDLLTVKLDITSTVDCHGFNTGTVEATVAGGQVYPDPNQQGYIYQWVRIENGAEQILSYTNHIADQLLAGIYKVNITDYASPVNTVSAQIEIEQPPLLITTLSTRNVSCFDGDDGYIHIAVQGGVGGYRLFCKQIGVDRAEAEYPIEADNKTFRLNRLIAGKYEIHINDANGYYAQIQGQDITTIEITQPNKALEIVKMEKIEPSGFGRSDGSITLYINEGTPNPDNTYNLTWKNKQGQVILVTTQGNFIGGQFVSTLSNQPDGEYTVEVRDGNYNIAYPDANTCCFVIATYKLTEPKKLIAGIEETHYVSCNGRSDGELIAHVTGGIVNLVSAQLPYKYQWYKEDNGSFVALVNERDSVLTNRETGNYKVEIEDYSRIVNQTSISYLLVQPDVLTATSTQKHITCGQTTEVKAFPVGGTAPYSYEWNMGETTQALQDRHPGKYFVFITDSRGCETTAISHITTPGDLEVSGTYRDPVCYQAQDGSITLSVAGGTAPYTYEWSNGATTKDLNNVGAGFYSVVVTDKDGCSYSESFILEDPEQLTVNIGEDRTLCNGQELTLTPEVKDPDTKFNWTSPNGFKSSNSSVTIKDAGEYFLTITGSKGCTASDKMTLHVNYTDISSEIVVASQVYVNDTIAIVNISNPEPDRIEWLFNKEDSIKIVQEEQHFARIIFPETGQYSIGIRSYVGDCYQDIIKTITVIEPDDVLNDRFKESLIDDFYVAPNPNDGKFQAIVKLNRESAIRLRVINFFNGTTISDRSFNGQSEYEIDYSLNNIGSGNLYLILLETSAGQMVFKMLGK